MNNLANIAKVANAASDLENAVKSPLQHVDDKATLTASDEKLANEFGMTDEDMKLMKRWAIFLRLYNIASCALLFAASILQLSNTDISVAFIAIYVFFFALILCCFETAFSVAARKIAENFGFLYNPVGRWLFLIFVSVLCSRLGILGYASIAAIGSSQLVYTYIMCKFPKYETYMRKSHYDNVTKK